MNYLILTDQAWTFPHKRNRSDFHIQVIALLSRELRVLKKATCYLKRRACHENFVEILQWGLPSKETVATVWAQAILLARVSFPSCSALSKFFLNQRPPAIHAKIHTSHYKQLLCCPQNVSCDTSCRDATFSINQNIEGFCDSCFL